MSDKANLRRESFACLRTLGAADKAARSARIVAALRERPEFRRARTVFSYLALPSEPDLAALVEDHPEKRWAFSRVAGGGENGDNGAYDGSGRLVFHQVDNFRHVRPGNFGIPEPDPGHCPALDPGEADLVLVPGIAFDPATGARLGRGKGHYDRFLAPWREQPNRPPVLGIAFAVQLRALQPEKHDVPMDGVVSDGG